MKETKIAYCITTRNGKTFWNRIGIGFVNQDGSINIKLEAMPMSGEFQLRAYVPRGGPDTSNEPTTNHSDDDVPF
jgi:hypothetical protein